MRNILRHFVGMLKNERGEAELLKVSIFSGIIGLGFLMVTSPDTLTKSSHVFLSVIENQSEFRKSYKDLIALQERAAQMADDAAERGTPEWFRAYEKAMAQVMMENQEVLHNYANAVVRTFTGKSVRQPMPFRRKTAASYDEDETDWEETLENRRSAMEDNPRDEIIDDELSED